MRDRYANIYGPNDAVGRLVSLDVVLLIGRILGDPVHPGRVLEAHRA